MSDVKHTRGAWAVMPEESDKSYVRIRGTQLGERYKIANVITPAYNGAHETEAEETRANARLIAAAPELLEALRELLNEAVILSERYLETFRDWPDDKSIQGWDKARWKRALAASQKADAAIAKAEGKS